MPNRLLALDVGAVLGYAVGAFGAEPVHGSFRLPTSSVHDLLGARLDRCENWLIDLFRTHAVTHVVLAERFHVRNTGEGATSFGLDAIVRMVAYRHQARMLAQPENTVRKEMLGRGAGPSAVMKELAMTWCERHGCPAATHHEADALVLWSWTERELARQAAPSAERFGLAEHAHVDPKNIAHRVSRRGVAPRKQPQQQSADHQQG